MHEISSLKYKYSDLEPYIDEETMRIHHTKHHQTYVDKLNAALESYPDLAKLPVEELLRDVSKIPEVIRSAVINNGGGHFNHSFFWNSISPNSGQPLEQTITLIERDFTSFDNFTKILKEMALKLFGSGWVWLTVDNAGKLNITSSPNQDIVSGAVLALDLWEHAYYLKYQNRRADYIDAFFKIINWDQVERGIASQLKML